MEKRKKEKLTNQWLMFSRSLEKSVLYLLKPCHAWPRGKTLWRYQYRRCLEYVIEDVIKDVIEDVSMERCQGFRMLCQRQALIGNDNSIPLKYSEIVDCINRMDNLEDILLHLLHPKDKSLLYKAWFLDYQDTWDLDKYIQDEHSQFYESWFTFIIHKMHEVSNKLFTQRCLLTFPVIMWFYWIFTNCLQVKQNEKTE
jgi:hypothetical protein